MEAVRKPKTKERSRVRDIVTPAVPTVASKETEKVQGGRGAFDRVLQEAPCEELVEKHDADETTFPCDERENCASPEPEELVIPPEDDFRDSMAQPRYIFPRVKEAIVVEPQLADTPTPEDAAYSIVPSLYPVLESSLNEEEGEMKPSAPEVTLSADAVEAASGFLSERELLAFYHNELYGASEALVDRFCREELSPTGPLSELLQRFKKACEHIEQLTEEVSANVASQSDSASKIWSMQPRMHTHTAPCGEFRGASGTGKYEIAVMNKDKTAELNSLLESNRDLTFKKLMSQEIEAKSIALQIQWIIVNVNTAFFTETGTAPDFVPTLIPPHPTLPSVARSRLRVALSDLFAFLRLPNLPKRCSDAAKTWATELTCALHKSMLPDDGLWLLCHTLRLPSPSAEWTAPLIQTFIHSNTSDKLKLDYCVAMLAQMMSPIKCRESFLSAWSTESSEESDESSASWMMVDEDGEKEQNPLTISESDLTTLLEQLPIADFYSLAVHHFQSIHSHPRDQLLSLIAFQLLLMKIFHIGLKTHAYLEYRAFCKQIGMGLRKSVRELASHWKEVRASLEATEQAQLQREIDRVVLLAVEYVLANRSLGLWQYLIDLPYDVISDECRLRVEYLLRKGGDENSKSARELFAVPRGVIVKEIKSTSLAKRLATAGAQDTVFLVQTLTALVVKSPEDPTSLMREVVQVCFVDECTRDALYKVGRETIATILGAKPESLDPLINIIDRNVDHIEEHVMDIFASAPLHLCRIRQTVMSGVISKWLINRAPETPGNRVARRILTALNWGYDEKGELWQSEGVHAACADVVAKAHLAHCTRSSGLISSLSKLIFTEPVHDANFAKFCWQQLVKLKLPLQVSIKQHKNDLAAHFLHAVQDSLSSADGFAESGLNCVDKLLTAGCSTAAAILLSRAFAAHYKNAATIINQENFLPLFERLLHADQSNYAYQLLAGSWPASPSFIGRVLSSAITYESQHVPDLAAYLGAWVETLVARRPEVFNNDQVSLQLLGTIARIATERDAQNYEGVVHKLQNMHTTSWMDLVSTKNCEEEKLYAALIHGKDRSLSPKDTRSSAYQRAPMRRNGSRSQPFPALPAHPELILPPTIDSLALGNRDLLVQPLIHNLSTLAHSFSSALVLVEGKDSEYLDLIGKLHTPTSIKLEIFVKCTEECEQPAMKIVKVPGTKFNKLTEIAAAFNREEHSSAIKTTRATVVDATALNGASLEYIARALCDILATDKSRRENLKSAARSLYQLITSSVSSTSSSSPMLHFPAAMGFFKNTLRALGKSFALVPAVSQQGLVDQVLAGSPLSPALVELFTQDEMHPENFAEIFKRLSYAVMKPELAKRAYALMNRISIPHSISPALLRPLLPQALISVTGATACKEKQIGAALRKVCMNHFCDMIFHQFPANFAYGLELTLKYCNMGTTPLELLREVVKRLEEHRLDCQTSLECVGVVTRALQQAIPSEQSGFANWSAYMMSMRAMVQLLARGPQQGVNGELREVLGRLESTIRSKFADK